MRLKPILFLLLLLAVVGCREKKSDVEYIRRIAENTEIYFTSNPQAGRSALEENAKLMEMWVASDDGRSEKAIRISQILNLLRLFKVERDLGDNAAAEKSLTLLQPLLAPDQDKMPPDAWINGALTAEGAYKYAVLVDEMFRKANPELGMNRRDR